MILVSCRRVIAIRCKWWIPALIGLWLAGCERTDAQSRSISEARNTLSAAGAGGSVAAPRGALSTSYGTAITTLKSAPEGSESGRAIVAAIEAGALGGQGDLAADEYRRADAELMSELNGAKALLRLYAEQRGLESALGGYDPNADIGRFDVQLSERERELESRRRALDEQKVKVEALVQRSRSLAERARSMMQSQSGLRQRLAEASAADRPGLAAEVNKARREAEGVMKESELVEAEAASIEPLTVELDLLQQQVLRQIESLRAAKAQAQSLARSRAEQSSEARRSADQTSTELSSAVEAVLRVLNERVKPAYESALSKLTQSASKFGQSRGGPDQKLLSVASGAAAQSVGALQREYGESLGRVASVLDLASRARPAIARADEFASASASIAEESRRAFEEALQQYDKARSLFQAGGGSTEMRERLDRLVARITESWVALGGVAPEEPKAEDPPADPGDPTEAAPEEPAPEGMVPEPEPAHDPAADSPDSPSETPPEGESPDPPPEG